MRKSLNSESGLGLSQHFASPKVTMGYLQQALSHLFISDVHPHILGSAELMNLWFNSPPAPAQNSGVFSFLIN